MAMPIRNPKQAAEELAIFDAFLNAHPSFAATVATTEPPDGEFPDMIVSLKDGSQIDFELVEWLHPEQTARAKRRERLAEAIESAIGEQSENPSQYFSMVVLFPQPHFPRFDHADAKCFLADVGALIEEKEQRWPRERFWHSLQGRHVSDFAPFPTLNKYVSKVIFDPLIRTGSELERFSGVPWINVSASCGSYSSETALSALNAVLRAKLNAYGSLRRPTRLLVYYAAAVAYNTPGMTSNLGNSAMWPIRRPRVLRTNLALRGSIC